MGVRECSPERRQAIFRFPWISTEFPISSLIGFFFRGASVIDSARVAEQAVGHFFAAQSVALRFGALHATRFGLASAAPAYAAVNFIGRRPSARCPCDRKHYCQQRGHPLQSSHIHHLQSDNARPTANRGEGHAGENTTSWKGGTAVVDPLDKGAVWQRLMYHLPQQRKRRQPDSLPERHVEMQQYEY